MAVWEAGRCFAPENCYHPCPVGFKMSTDPGCATCCGDCLIGLIVDDYVKGKGGTFALPVVSASLLLHLNRSTLYL